MSHGLQEAALEKSILMRCHIIAGGDFSFGEFIAAFSCFYSQPLGMLVDVIATENGTCRHAGKS